MKQAQKVKMREEEKKQQLISIKTDCQTRWGLFENWGTVDKESWGVGDKPHNSMRRKIFYLNSRNVLSCMFFLNNNTLY